uniref:IncF plasmid conjugative transfer protein TrbB n=1 Tax=Escherichia coli TaxID=562 RepID=A0A8A4RZ95_ECOLX|nr:IncF plasmid conjugative transfer protein TrbB [Escherichia coli]
MSLIKSLLFTLLLAAAAVQASTRDEIERLWNPQGMAAQPAQPAAGTSARTEKPAPAGSASATAGRLTWPTGRWCCLCRGIALTVTSLTRY